VFKGVADYAGGVYACSQFQKQDIFAFVGVYKVMEFLILSYPELFNKCGVFAYIGD
jgi:hypothetical protein